MINKVVHLADIHIRKSLKRHSEYKHVLKRTVESIKEQNPDRIVLVGDLYHDFIDIEGEALIIATNFLKELSQICKVIITRGNHDFMKKNHNRYDVIKTVTEMINEPNIQYLDRTDFYIDDNITWAVWHHPDKQGPWRQIDHNRDEKQTYIDLFHDPVRNCITPLGWPMEKDHYINVDEFKGDLGMFGDIHLKQHVDNEGKKSFCGSLIQQSFDEKIYGHGYLLWDINEQTHELIEIYNDYRRITIDLNKPDYDNLNIVLDETFPNMHFKVKWSDTRNNINSINQSSIREHLQKYNYLSIVWDKNIIKTSEMEVDDSIRHNINNKEVQQKVFSDYLKELGYEEEIINEVLNVDNKIFDRLNLEDGKYTEYSIDSIYIDNFKSYDKCIIDWKNDNGIIQITGKNQVGKTTLLDAICYVLYGKTLSTSKKQKHGDNRFINNKKDLNYCTVRIIVTINDVKYILERTSKRKMHSKENRVTSVTTEFLIYEFKDIDLEDVSLETLEVDDSLTGERYLDTQKTIQKSIGTFEDFIQTVLINADNLNSLISIDRSKFIDSVMRYAGYTIFEDKLEEFKEYKKSELKKYEKIVLDLNYENDLIKELGAEKALIEEDIKEHNSNLSKLNSGIVNTQNNIDNLLRSLITIDPDVIKIDLDDIKLQIENNHRNIKIHNSDIDKLKEELNNLSTEEEISNAKINLELTLKDYEKNSLLIEKHKDSINLLASNKKDYENKILLEEKEKTNYLNNEKTSITNSISIKKSEKQNFENELKHILDNAKRLKNSIKELEESKTCSVCNQTLNDDAIENIKIKIENEKTSLEKLKTEHSNITNSIKKIEEEILVLNNSINEISIDPKFDEQINVYNNLIDDIKKEGRTIQEEMSAFSETLDSLKEDENTYKNVIDSENKKISLNNDIKEIEVKISSIEVDNKKLGNDIEKYNLNEKSLTHNEKVNSQIQIHNTELEKDKQLINKYNSELNTLTTNLSLKEKNIEDKLFRIEKYKEQIRRDEIFKIYQKCVHRDGIPTSLLKLSINNINDEISNVLKKQDYIAYFDTDLNLLMSSLNKLSSNQNVIEGSGKERTFIALGLILALRRINNTSKPNFILLDEMTGKLIDESVEEFMELLYNIKELIDKIIIIEHNHTINYDYRIDVAKNEKGISTCILE